MPLTAVREIVKQVLRSVPAMQSSAHSSTAPATEPPPLELVESMRRLLTVYRPADLVRAIGLATGAGDL